MPPTPPFTKFFWPCTIASAPAHVVPISTDWQHKTHMLTHTHLEEIFWPSDKLPPHPTCSLGACRCNWIVHLNPNLQAVLQLFSGQLSLFSSAGMCVWWHHSQAQMMSFISITRGWKQHDCVTVVAMYLPQFWQCFHIDFFLQATTLLYTCLVRLLTCTIMYYWGQFANLHVLFAIIMIPHSIVQT